MRYAMFYTSEKDEAIGSDCYIFIDGRLSPFNAMEDARQHAKKMNNILNKGFVYFQIRKSDHNNIFRYYRPETKLMRVE